jgi:hypothetical protein
MAYEVVYSLFDGFARRAVAPCDIIVAPNNSALLVGAAVQSITEIPVCVIDKLGPIPTRNLSSMHTSLAVAGKRVCLLVEVSATGGEIDRSIQYLVYRRADVQRIICCYHLNVGRPLLCDYQIATFLCSPKTDLGYVYRSK